MDDLHLTDDDLDDLGSFFTDSRRAKRIVRQLLSGCEHCQRLVASSQLHLRSWSHGVVLYRREALALDQILGRLLLPVVKGALISCAVTL